MNRVSRWFSTLRTWFWTGVWVALLVVVVFNLSNLSQAQAITLNSQPAQGSGDRPKQEIHIDAQQATTGAKAAADDLIQSPHQSNKETKTNTQAEFENVFQAAKQKLGETTDSAKDKLNLN